MLAENVTFAEACGVLGIGRETRPLLTANRKRAAQRVARRAADQRAKLNTMLTDRLDDRDFADEIGAFDLAEMIDREIIILHGFYDSLEYSKGITELLALRESIENLTAGEEISLL